MNDKPMTRTEVDILITERLLLFYEGLVEDGHIKISDEPRWFFDDGTPAPTTADCRED